MHILSRTLDSLDLGTPVTHANVTMVPLLSRAPAAPAAPDYLLLDEALDAGLAEVTEVSSGGSVPELHFRNKADRSVLLVDGEELVGAKQNRVLNLSILVAAGQEISIPVSCVEAGRWAWQSSRFTSGKRKLHAKARMAKMRGVSASLRESGQRARSDIQSEVWRAVEDKMVSFECRTATQSLHDVYESAEERLRPMREAFVPGPRQVGAAFFVNGALAGMELFDAAPTLAKLLPKLVDSYAFDAIEATGEAGADAAAGLGLGDVRALLARITGAQETAYAGVAVGTDVRIEAEDLQAAALCVEGRVVHMTAFGGA